MQQTGRNTDVVEPHFGQDLGHLERMNKIRLAGRSLLPPVVKRREKICPPDEINVRTRPVFLYLIYYIFDPDHLDPKTFYILHQIQGNY